MITFLEFLLLVSVLAIIESIVVCGLFAPELTKWLEAKTEELKARTAGIKARDTRLREQHESRRKAAHDSIS